MKGWVNRIKYRHSIRSATWSVLLTLAAVAAARDGGESLAWSDFKRRVEVSAVQLPRIVAAAEAAAARKAENPEALLNITYHRQPSFAEEMLNRSGGLAGALPSEERSAWITDDDIVVFSVRSWEKNGQVARDYLRECREKGWMILLFASQAGRPDDLEVDFFIDNGASSGGEQDAAVNSIANALNGWLWVCEYTAALTRQGRHPGILQSITTAGSRAHNRVYQDRRTRHHTYPIAVRVPAGDLARIYLRRVERMLRDLSGAETADQLETAARIIADRIKKGGKVFVSTNTHIMLSEMDKNNKTPWTALNTLRRMEDVLQKHTQPGDLFFWLGFNGVSIWSYPRDDAPSQLYIDYDRPLREAGLDLIVCCAHDPLHPDNNGQGALAHIEQNWEFGDAVVPVPFPPGRIAPVSGLYQGLLYRMLDEMTFRLLKNGAETSPEHD